VNWSTRNPKVALIDMARCEQALAVPACLSTREMHRWRQYRHVRRQREWLAGRLAAKALFWQRLERSDVAVPVKALQVQHLTQSTLEALPMEDLHQIEVLAPEPGKAPQLFWKESLVSCGLSVAHAGGLVCVAISLTGDIGIDIETCELRASAYYRSSFSETEHQWVQRLGESNQDRQILGYTLLWAFKESLFKTGRLLQPGMIAADTIIVDLHGLIIEQPSDWSPPNNVTMLPVQLRSGSLPRDLQANAAYCFNGQCVITIIHLHQPTSVNL
jgi:4'-phosphopantetheinyl transferase EntD